MSGLMIVATLAQRLTAQPVGSRGKFPPVVLGEPEAPVHPTCRRKSQFSSIRYASSGPASW